jgi:4-amino-4-deoxy-L-arabinose transferase-like glycosyltransferase
MITAAVYSVFGDSDSAVRLLQISCDSFCAVLVLIIAARVFNGEVAAAAGTVTALSPHLSFYSLWLSPDTFPVLPIMGAVYLTMRAVARPRLATVAAAGVLIGLSCWLRANGLLLAPFLAAFVALVINRGYKLRFAGVLLGSALVVISPMTIRNWVVFHRFVPVSIAGG